MLYFIPWVVFILAAIIAVPIASMMDKKKAGASYIDSAQDDAFDEYSDEDESDEYQQDAEAVDDFGAEPLPADDAFGAEEFAEFE